MNNRRHTDICDRRTKLFHRIFVVVIALFLAGVFAIEASVQNDQITEERQR